MVRAAPVSQDRLEEHRESHRQRALEPAHRPRTLDECHQWQKNLKVLAFSQMLASLEAFHQHSVALPLYHHVRRMMRCIRMQKVVIFRVRPQPTVDTNHRTKVVMRQIEILAVQLPILSLAEATHFQPNSNHEITNSVEVPLQISKAFYQDCLACLFQRCKTLPMFLPKPRAVVLEGGKRTQLPLPLLTQRPQKVQKHATLCRYVLCFFKTSVLRTYSS